MGRMENWQRRRKIEDFEPRIQDLGTTYQKTNFLAVLDESKPNFWLCQFLESSVLKISDACNWREMLHSKNKSKAPLFILCFTFIF
jgi:hypothetical protein